MLTSGKRWTPPSENTYDPYSQFMVHARPSEGREMGSLHLDAVAEQVMKANGPVFALVAVRMLLFAEARFQFRQMRGGRPGDLFGNADLSLLERPWPGGTTGDLLTRMLLHADLAGTAFVTPYEDRLQVLRPDWVTIVTGSRLEPELAGDAIDGELLGYIYHPRTPGGASIGEGTVLFPDEVACFAPYPDPQFRYRGMSWITPVIREIQGDSAAMEHKRAYFRNGTLSQLAVVLDASVGPDQFDRFVDAMEAKHAGSSNAYKTIYLGGGADAKALQTDLRALDFKNVQGHGETRLASAAGVPAVIVGFSEGMGGSSLNAGNYAQARRRFGDGTLRPLWRNAAGSLANITRVPADAELWYDERDVAFLREDQQDAADIAFKRAQTIRQLVDAGYDPESVITAVEADDFSRLKHSGLFSIQLQEPIDPNAPKPDAVPPGAPSVPELVPTTNGKAP